MQRRGEWEMHRRVVATAVTGRKQQNGVVALTGRGPCAMHVDYGSIGQYAFL